MSWVAHTLAFGLVFVVVGCSPGANPCNTPDATGCVQDGSIDSALDGSSSGAECGGFAGLTCEGTEFCDYAPDTSCGSGDQLGTCRVVPGLCSGEVAPVCGCDQVKYNNACEAAKARVSVAHAGDCP